MRAGGFLVVRHLGCVREFVVVVVVVGTENKSLDILPVNIVNVDVDM